jgi:long-chain acyl-CoA synthetase
MMTGRYGYNVYPTQVEDALYQHPDFREAAAIDVSDSYRGETVKAIVALREGAAPLLLKDLKMFSDRQACSDRDADNFLEIIEVIPKTAVGKVSRKLLQHREQARSRHRRTSCHQLNGLHKRKELHSTPLNGERENGQRDIRDQ